jgi:predicted 3-demethylubiquinone-9 3-methyltransferase (glyoxalase superfamily)
MMPEWDGIKGEVTPRGCPSSPSTGVETGAFTAAGADLSFGPGQNVLQTDFEQATSVMPTVNDRQRTAQACDKCRERKTKASLASWMGDPFAC